MMFVIYPNNACHAVCNKLLSWYSERDMLDSLIKSSLEISQIMSINRTEFTIVNPKQSYCENTNTRGVTPIGSVFN